MAGIVFLIGVWVAVFGLIAVFVYHDPWGPK